MPETRPPDVIAIAAVARNGVIGADGDIPWRIAADWARFKRLTLGHVLVMGRKTYASIGRPLPGRTTVVITRDRGYQLDQNDQLDQNGPDRTSVRVVHDVDAALDLAVELDPAGPVFVGGGSEIYRAAWPRTTALEITEVEQSPDGDVRFPIVEPDEWLLEHREPHDGYAFARYRRHVDRAADPGVDTVSSSRSNRVDERTDR